MNTTIVAVLLVIIATSALTLAAFAYASRENVFEDVEEKRLDSFLIVGLSLASLFVSFDTLLFAPNEMGSAIRAAFAAGVFQAFGTSALVAVWRNANRNGDE